MLKAHVYKYNKQGDRMVEVKGEGDKVYDELIGLTLGMILRISETAETSPLEIFDMLKEDVPVVLPVTTVWEPNKKSKKSNK